MNKIKINREQNEEKSRELKPKKDLDNLKTLKNLKNNSKKNQIFVKYFEKEEKNAKALPFRVLFLYFD